MGGFHHDPGLLPAVLPQTPVTTFPTFISVVTPAGPCTAGKTGDTSSKGSHTRGRHWGPRSGFFPPLLHGPQAGWGSCIDAALAPMRLWGLRGLNYLDNLLVCASSADQCWSHVNLLVSHIQAPGLCLNPYKCRLEPSQTAVFLVMSLDSVRASVSLTAEWQHFTLHSRVTWGLCLRLIGLMAAMVLVTQGGGVHEGCGVKSPWTGPWASHHINM